MKKIIYTFFFLVSIVTQAQNEKYIEVQAKDFVIIKPVSIVYQVWLKEPVINQPENYDYRNKEFDYQGEINKYYVAKDAELRQKLKNKGFAISRINNGEYQVTSSHTLDDLKRNRSIVLSNEQDLESLIVVIKSIDFLEGSLSEVKYKKTDVLEDALMKKLMAKAKKRAERIAKHTNLQLGKVISVSETKQKDDEEYYYRRVPREAIYRDTENNSNNVNGKFEKTIVVRFEAF